jgi:hypothetical protein
MVICTREDLSESLIPIDTNYLDEEECQQMVALLRSFFASFVDERPYGELGLLSGRAENILRRYHAKTVGDLRRLLTQALSNQGLPGVGTMVREEWAALLR